MIIPVSRVVGRLCITAEDGARIHALVADALIRTTAVIEVDFTGCDIFASSFFNASIGALVADFSRADLNARLRLTHLSNDGLQLVFRVVENAREYNEKPSVRAAMDALAANISGEWSR